MDARLKVVNLVQENFNGSRFRELEVVIHELHTGLVLPKSSNAKQGDSVHKLHE